MKVVFLYTEIAEYFIACCKALLKENVEIHIIKYSVNAEAPFEFQLPEKIHIYERNKYTTPELMNLVNTIAPDCILCSGWTDKGYLKVCKYFKNKSITVLTLDNHWNGNFKQWIARIISPFYLHQRFLKCWVPGSLQFEYALKLGFKKENILTGFYSCDFDLFYNQYLFLPKTKSR